jgi:hypothetical protein
MSIPIRFDWYTWDGQLVAANRGCFTISITSNPGDLRLLGQHLLECNMQDHYKYIGEGVRYVCPLSAPDYMFDLENPLAILPNKFKEYYK